MARSWLCISLQVLLLAVLGVVIVYLQEHVSEKHAAEVRAFELRLTGLEKTTGDALEDATDRIQSLTMEYQLARDKLSRVLAALQSLQDDMAAVKERIARVEEEKDVEKEEPHQVEQAAEAPLPDSLKHLLQSVAVQHFMGASLEKAAEILIERGCLPYSSLEEIPEDIKSRIANECNYYGVQDKLCKQEWGMLDQQIIRDLDCSGIYKEQPWDGGPIGNQRDKDADPRLVVITRPFRERGVVRTYSFLHEDYPQYAEIEKRKEEIQQLFLQRLGAIIRDAAAE